MILPAIEIRQLYYMRRHVILATICGGFVILIYVRGMKLKGRLQKGRIKNMEPDKNLVAQQHVFEQELIAAQKNIMVERQREATSIALQLADHYYKLNQLVQKIIHPGTPLLSTLLKTYPRPTKNDIEFCYLINLKLSYKEIASLLQIHMIVITKKYLIREKKDLQDEVAFEQLISEI